MDAFLGEIRMMGFGIVPRGWQQCNGQLLSISSNQALFALLGTTFGGNGVQTFGLPDLRGRVTMGFGQGPGLQTYVMGQVAGTQSVTLLTTNMPAHIHPIAGTLKANVSPAGNNPTDSYPAQSTVTQYSTGTSNANMGGTTLSGNTDMTGGNQPHENRQPLMAMNYCIATQGIFPSRS